MSDRYSREQTLSRTSAVLDRTMPIVYSNICRVGAVLCEQNDSPFEQIPEIARSLLARVTAQQQKKSYSFENKYFHYAVDSDGLVAMCVADDQTPHRISFAFLEDIRKRFRATNGLLNWHSAEERFYQDNFSRTLHEQMLFYSQDPNADQLRRVKGEIDQVKTVMIQNIDKVLERGDQIETLVQKTSVLDAQSIQFRRSSTQLKKKLWWKNMWLWVVIGAVLLLLVGGITVGVLWKFGVIKF